MSKRFPRARIVFEAALDLPPGRRAEFVAAASNGDESLRLEVMSLLRFAGDPDVDENVCDPGDYRMPLRDRLIGTTIGRYTIRSVIGEGGFGSVYLAEQSQPVVRKVALKVIKPGMDSANVISRFEAERQALAMMSHRSVARMIDGGSTETGHPFFVMEYIDGVPITRYCDRHRVGVPDRLRLFMAVCDGVQHAHAKGVIHRDLKPGNVLVSEEPEGPRPVVIDFGVAKALHDSTSLRTRDTAEGGVIGTPEYMSPEQAAATPNDVDTRSDVYALGVLLYELMTGSLPFEFQRAGVPLSEIIRTIREVEAPRPSARLRSEDKRDRSTVVEAAGRRSTDVKALMRVVHGDLDWIVMKCLDKDRERRYSSPAAVAADIARHLADEPVQAGPPTSSYRLRKFVRRHRKSVIATLLVGVFVMAAALTLLVIDSRSRQAQALAVFLDRYQARVVEDFVDRSIESGELAPAVRLLDSVTDRLDDDAGLIPAEVDIRYRYGIARWYADLGECQKAEAMMRSCADAVHSAPDTARAALAASFAIAEHCGPAGAVLDSARALLQCLETHSDDLAESDRLAWRADVHRRTSLLLEDAGRLPEAEAQLVAAFRCFSSLAVDCDRREFLPHAQHTAARLMTMAGETGRPDADAEVATLAWAAEALRLADAIETLEFRQAAKTNAHIAASRAHSSRALRLIGAGDQSGGMLSLTRSIEAARQATDDAVSLPQTMRHAYLNAAARQLSAVLWKEAGARLEDDDAVAAFPSALGSRSITFGLNLGFDDRLGVEARTMDVLRALNMNAAADSMGLGFVAETEIQFGEASAQAFAARMKIIESTALSGDVETARRLMMAADRIATRIDLASCPPEAPFAKAILDYSIMLFNNERYDESACMADLARQRCSDLWSDSDIDARYALMVQVAATLLARELDEPSPASLEIDAEIRRMNIDSEVARDALAAVIEAVTNRFQTPGRAEVYAWVRDRVVPGFGQTFSAGTRGQLDSLDELPADVLSDPIGSDD